MRAAVVVLAVAVVLAGCPAFGDDGDSTPEPTPGATASPTQTPQSIGLSASGVTDPYQLREAHIRVLADRSYTYNYTLSVSWAGRTRGRVDVTARVGADRSESLLEREVLGDVPAWLVPVGSTVRYDAGTTAYVRTPETGAVGVEQSPSGAAIADSYAPDSGFVYLLLSDVDTAVTGTENVDGRTLFVVSGTAPSVRSPRGRAQNVSVRAVVAPSGLVVEFRAAYDLRPADPVGDGRSQVRVVHEIAYSAVGETAVPRPDWVVAATTPTEATVGGGPDAEGNGTSDSPVQDDAGGNGDSAASSPAGAGYGRPPAVPTTPGPTRLDPPIEG